MKINHYFSLLLCGMMFCFGLFSHAQQQFQGLCNRVKIEIEQELTTERIGFEAVLKVTNNDGQDPINQFSAALTFVDVETGEDASDRFFVQAPDLESLNRIDGTGIIGPTKTGIVTWFIIPKTGDNAPGGENPQGKEYKIGCSLSGFIRGTKIPEDVLFAMEDTITVKPEPQLDITYFQPRDVQGDDPFTPEVESPIPFTLGVLVQNSGFGIARSVKIDSKQPKIVENKNGLLLIARLLGARVQDSPLQESSLLVNLGDIEPQKVKKGAWDMITSLSGEFVEFKASYRHADDLGGESTSLIKSLNAHFIAREVLNDEPGRDSIKDFLADTDRDSNILPDTLYETDGAILPVNYQPQAVAGNLTGGQTTVTLAADREGWVYMRLDDPGQARYPISRVVRNDGKVLNSRNYWTNIRYRREDNFRQTFLNLFDRVESGSEYTYSITYETTNNDVTSPETRLRFSGESSGDGPFFITTETQMYFTSEDDSPVSIEYRIDGGPYRPALPFDLDEPGSYTVDFFATDAVGNTESVKSATLIIPEAGTAVALDSDESRIFPTDLLSIRPGQTPIRATIPAGPVSVTGMLKIHRGVKAYPQLAGLPVSPTPNDTASISVSGLFADYYRYRIGASAWSSERQIAEPLDLAGLSGEVVLQVVARHQSGNYPPDDEALEVRWVIDPSAEDLVVTGVPPTPSRDAANVTLGISTSGGSSLYRWSGLAPDFFRAQEPFTSDIVLERLLEGEYGVRIITNQGGTFPDEVAPDPVTEARWTFDQSYGFDFSDLEEIRNIDLGQVNGETVEFVWDGEDEAGVAQIPGPYTAYLELTDALGNITRAATLIEIEGLASDRQIIADLAEAPRNLKAKGNWVVWEQKTGSVTNVHAYDLVANTGDIAITGSEDLAQEDPATDGKYLVWQSRLPNGATDLLYRELAGGAPSPVTSSEGELEANPDCEYPWFVYQVKPADSPSSPWQVEAWNAETDDRFRVSPGQGNQFRPRIHGGRIVWEDHRDVGPGEVYFADLETREVRRITNNTFGQNNPTIYGDVIAWQDNRGGQVDIWMRDLRRSISEQVTATAFNEGNPIVEGNWILFTEDSLGATTENFVLYDLQAGSQLALTRATRRHVPGGLGSGFAAWIEQTPAGRRAVISRLPGLQAVMTSSNALAVSAGLANRYATAFELLNGWGGATGIRTVSLYSSLSPVVKQTAEYNGGSPAGDNFPLTAGSFLWVEFEEANLVDLGSSDSGEIMLDEGVNTFGYTGFPVGYTSYDLISSIGATKVKAVRIYDAFAGLWRAVEVDETGNPTGPNFSIPRVSTVLVDARENTSFTPNLPF